MKKTHTTFPRGQRVRVVLDDGVVFVAKFHDRTDRDVTFKTDGGTVSYSHRVIRSISYYKVSTIPPK